MLYPAMKSNIRTARPGQVTPKLTAAAPASEGEPAKLYMVARFC